MSWWLIYCEPGVLRRQPVWRQGSWEKATRNNSPSLSFLTHNRPDYERLANEYLTAGEKHYGLLIAVRRRPHDIARRLLKILNFVTADEMENQLRYL